MSVATRMLIGRQAAWLLFFASILAAWLALFAMQPDIDLPEGWQAIGADYLASLCRPTAADAGYGSMFVMWALMALAMMAPTAFPALSTFADLRHSGASNTAGLLALFSGYLAIWLGFSAVAAVFQLFLASSGLLDPWGRSTVTVFNAFLLALAGLYQFSALKAACLRSCQSPMMFFLARWRDGAAGAFRMGLDLGAVCLGCCWALMLLAFVAGTMNLAFMGLAALLMTLEKLPSVGRHLSAPLGYGLLIASTVTLASTFTSFT